MESILLLSQESQPNGLPMTRDFDVRTGVGAKLLIVSGSAYATAPGHVVVEVLIGANVVGTLRAWAHAANHHVTFPTALIPVSLAEGATYTLTVRELDGSTTVTDHNDHFNAVLLANE